MSRRRWFASAIVAVPMVLALVSPSGAAFTQGYRGRIVAKATGAPIPGAQSFTCDASSCPNSFLATANGAYKNPTNAESWQPVYGLCCGTGNPNFFVPVTYGPGGKSLPGFDSAHSAPVVVSSAAVTSGINFKLPSGGGLKVHLQDTSGTPIANVLVVPQWKVDGHQSGLAGSTNANGDIEIDGVMAGKNNVRTLDLNGIWADGSAGPVVVAVGQIAGPVVIVLSPAAAVAAAHRAAHPAIVVKTSRGIALVYGSRGPAY